MSSNKTYINAKFYISDTPQNTDLDDNDTTGFPSLSYTQVPSLGNLGDTGVTQNGVRYPVYDRPLSIAGKGAAEGNAPTAEFLDETSAGLTALLAAADPSNADNYAFKIERADGIHEYFRALAMSPSYLKGNNEAFARVAVPLMINQQSVFVDTNTP